MSTIFAHSPRLILAPLAAITHEAFRRCVYNFGGCDEYYTEMIHAPTFLQGGPFEAFYARTAPTPEKLVWQLTGSEKKSLADCATMLMHTQEGKKTIGIDINMGCSAPTIYKQGAGIAWLSKSLAEIADMLLLVRESFQGRLSVKTRLPTCDTLEATKKKLFEFSDMLVDCGVDGICLHPRRQKDSYRQVAQWQYVYALKTHACKRYTQNFFVYGNGDICDTQSFLTVYDIESSKHCSVPDGFMIGRAAVQKPWIFAQLQHALGNQATITTTTVDIITLITQFLKDLQEYQPSEFYETRIKRFFAYFCKNFTFSHYLFTEIMRAKTPEKIIALFKEYFSQTDDKSIFSFV